MKRTALILSLCAAGAFLYLKNKPAEPATVQAASASPTTRVVAAGRVEPVSEEVRIGTELDGKLASVPVEEGDPVRRGQIIATLSNGDFAARVALAEASIHEREAELERLRNGARPQERAEAEANVAEAGAQLDHAHRELDRMRGLLAKGAVSRLETDAAEREFNVARARSTAVQERTNLVNAATRHEEIRRAEAEVSRARAQRQEAEALLAKTIIRSPIDGVVLRKHRKTGESVSTQNATAILVLGDVSTLRVRLDVDETDVAKIRVGQPVRMKATAYGDKVFTGKIARIGRILGRKNVRTDEPTERVDTKILETLVDLDPGSALPLGLRVDAFINL